MVSIDIYAIALLGLGRLTHVGQEPPTRGSEETRPHIPSSGLTLEILNGPPPTRDGYVPVNHGYQPIVYTYPYPYAGLNAPFAVNRTGARQAR